MPLKILVLQACYQDDPSRIEEHQSFAARSGLDISQIVPHDLLSSCPTLHKIRQYDGVMIGGSGDFDVSKGNLPGETAVFHLLAELVSLGTPMFATCFGFQLIVAALGGEIVYDPNNIEIGTYALTLTEAGKQDPLMGSLPATFHVQQGHKDRATRLPDGIPNLAASAGVPYQAFRIPNQPIWATQFHPELTKTTNLGRYKRYMGVYSKVLPPVQIQAQLNLFDESPDTENLIARFVQLVFEV